LNLTSKSEYYSIPIKVLSSD